jgi:hypothetical protein
MGLLLGSDLVGLQVVGIMVREHLSLALAMGAVKLEHEGQIATLIHSSN